MIPYAKDAKVMTLEEESPNNNIAFLYQQYETIVIEALSRKWSSNINDIVIIDIECYNDYADTFYRKDKKYVSRNFYRKYINDIVTKLTDELALKGWEIKYQSCPFDIGRIIIHHPNYTSPWIKLRNTIANLFIRK